MTGLENLLVVAFLVLVGLAIACSALIVAYVLSCFVLGRTAGAINRYTWPITELERRRVLADERVARDNTRSRGQLIDISTVTTPNGYDHRWREAEAYVEERYGLKRPDDPRA